MKRRILTVLLIVPLLRLLPVAAPVLTSPAEIALTFTKHIIDSSFVGAESVYAIDLDSDGDMDGGRGGSMLRESRLWRKSGLFAFRRGGYDER